MNDIFWAIHENEFTTYFRTVVATSRLSLERPGSSTSDSSHLWGGLDIMSPEIIPGTKEEEEFASTTTPPEGQHNAPYNTPRCKLYFLLKYSFTLH